MPPLRSVLLLLTALLPSALPDRTDRNNDRNDKVIRIGAFSNYTIFYLSWLFKGLIFKCLGNGHFFLRRGANFCVLFSGTYAVVAPINAERLHHFDAIFGHFIEGKNSVLCANTLLFLPVNKLLLAVLNFLADYVVNFCAF
jgi:hypothetical protein